MVGSGGGSPCGRRAVLVQVQEGGLHTEELAAYVLQAEGVQHSAVVTYALAETDRDSRTDGRDGFDDNAKPNEAVRAH